MSSFFSAMISSGVGGLIRAGSQSTAAAQPTENQTATIQEVAAHSETLTAEEPTLDSGMDVDTRILNDDSAGAGADSASEPGPSTVNVTANPPYRAEVVRASSVPLNREAARRPRYGYVFDARMMSHKPLSSGNNGDHPEQPERIMSIYQKLREAQLLERMRVIPIRLARKSEVLLVHSEDHWEKVQGIARKFILQLRQCDLLCIFFSGMNTEQIVLSESYYEFLSLYVCPSTTLAAQFSCGGVIEAALAVARGELDRSFAIVRPPGHHAEPEEHMGFCFFNNVAVATRVVQQLTPIKRVMILDW